MTRPAIRRYNRNRDAILDAARAIIVEGGIDSLSMRSLADALDYSPSALYKYFDNKDDLIQGVALQGLAELGETIENASAGKPSYTEKVLATGHAYLEFAYTNPQLYAVMFNTQRPPHDDPHAAPPEEGDAFMVMVRLFQAAIESGEFIARDGYGAMEMAFHAWVTVHGAVMLRATGTAPLPLFDEMTERVLHALIKSMT